MIRLIKIGLVENRTERGVCEQQNLYTYVHSKKGQTISEIGEKNDELSMEVWYHGDSFISMIVVIIIDDIRMTNGTTSLCQTN